MSTILKALRKAKTDYPEESVEARPEILSSHAHDYLATLPEGTQDQVRMLRRLVYASVAMIVLLLLVVLSLLFRHRNSRVGGTVAVGAVSAGVSSPTAPSPSPAASVASPAAVVPASSPVADKAIQITVASPLATPVETPLPPPPPPVIVSAAEEGDEALAARAVELRAQAERSSARRAQDRSRSDSESGSIQNIRISGIVWDRTSPMAMVDGKIVRPGSVVRGARIVQINKDSIVFEMNGRQYTVRQ